MPNIHFVPECFAETELVKLFKLSDDYLNHAEGIHSVCKVLRMDDQPSFMNLGFVDDDKKNLPPYIDEFTFVDENPSIKFKRHPATNDFILVAKPAIEKFILSQLEELGKRPAEYDLPNDFKLFKKSLKSSKIENHEGYKRLLKDLILAQTSGIKFINEKIRSLRHE